MRGFLAAARLLPGPMRERALALPDREKRRCEELRLRMGRRPTVLLAGAERPFDEASVTAEDLRAVAESASRSSLHSVARELTRGYLTAPGGVRVGVCGAAAGEDGLRAFSSLALRVPRQVPGCADGVWPAVTAGGFRSLLILSPPGAGKTTLLRELVRKLSEDGYRVCAADERGEIADAASGTPGFDVGPCTDVMTGVPKARAAMMLLRAMGPQVLAMDEITEEADAEALLHAVGCGVQLLATVHAGSPAEALRRPACRALMEAGAFSQTVTVSVRDGRRVYETEELA